MFVKILAIFVIITCIKAEESNDCLFTSSLEVDSLEDNTSDDVLSVTDTDNKIKPLPEEKLQQKIADAVNLTLSSNETAVDEAEKEWKDWAKNYNCTNSSTSLVRCVTSVRNLKSPCLWRTDISQTEFPPELPSDASPEVSDDTWFQNIRTSLEEWFSKLNKFIFKSKNITQKIKPEKGN